MTTEVHERVGAGRRPVWPQVIGLLILAPICAEYLAAYDDSTGDIPRLLGGLLILGPLYGAPALLIREAGRRTGSGLRGMLLLGTAVGLFQAGIVDQSLFSEDYRAIGTWDDFTEPTAVEPLGLSAYTLLTFVGGHVAYSFCAPIVLIESLRPAGDPRAHEPWLSRWGLGVCTGLWLAASALVYADHLGTEESHATAAELVGAAVVIVLLVVAAISVRPGRVPVADRRVPRALVVLLMAGGVAATADLVPPTWPGVAVLVVVLLASGALLGRFAGSADWGRRHTLAVAAGLVFSRAVLAFMYFPLLGQVSAPAKYGHNLVLLAAVGAVVVLGSRRTTG